MRHVAIDIVQKVKMHIYYPSCKTKYKNLSIM